MIIKNEADIVLGSRFLAKNNSTIAVSKKIVLQVARYINYLMTGMLLTDAHNGLRAMNRKALDNITLTENRMAHASEILFEIKKHQLSYKEAPVHIQYTDYSRHKGQHKRDGIKVLFDLALYKFFK